MGAIDGSESPSLVQDLWPQTVYRSQAALACGALQPIETEYEFIESDGISFLVRILANLQRKEQENQRRSRPAGQSREDFNPFLPYDKDLFVTDISETHLCLLNKYNVVQHHLLIVTRQFEAQENWLTIADFLALWLCLQQVDGLGFYNGGAAAGASQRHKHLQLAPFPIAPEGVSLPIEPAIATATFHNSIGHLQPFQFSHGLVRLTDLETQTPLHAAEHLYECYRRLLQHTQLLPDGSPTAPLSNSQTGAYNLLVTRRWMLLVRRSQEKFQSISINSLGFAGTLLVKNAADLALLKEVQPLRLLQAVAVQT